MCTTCSTVEDGSWRICTLSLRTGTIIIGWLDLVYAIIRGISISTLLGEYGGSDGYTVFDCVVFVIVSLLCVLEFIASFTLLWGVRNRLFAKIKLWVPAQKVFLVLYLIIFIMLLILGFHWLTILSLIFFHLATISIQGPYIDPSWGLQWPLKLWGHLAPRDLRVRYCRLCFF